MNRILHIPFRRLGIVLILCGFVFSLSGCGMFSIVRIPVPVPVFSMDDCNASQKEPQNKENRTIASSKTPTGINDPDLQKESRL